MFAMKSYKLLLQVRINYGGKINYIWDLATMSKSILPHPTVEQELNMHSIGGECIKT